MVDVFMTVLKKKLTDKIPDHPEQTDEQVSRMLGRIRKLREVTANVSLTDADLNEGRS